MLFLAIKKNFLAFGLFCSPFGFVCHVAHIIAQKCCPSLAGQRFQLSKVLKIQIPLIWPQNVLALSFELENF